MNTPSHAKTIAIRLSQTAITLRLYGSDPHTVLNLLAQYAGALRLRVGSGRFHFSHPRSLSLTLTPPPEHDPREAGREEQERGGFRDGCEQQLPETKEVLPGPKGLDDNLPTVVHAIDVINVVSQSSATDQVV